MPENGAQKRVIATPRGTRDLGFKDAIMMNETLSIIEEIFKRFGFSPIDTPSIENIDIINAKAYGDEPSKQIFMLDGGDSGLRYDFTVPLARFVAMNKDLSLPFKRYQIGKVWRKDEPQYMRSREFVQADIDIVGSKELDSEAEVICTTAAAIEKVGIKNYTVLLNHRQILNALLDLFGIEKEKQIDAIRIIDKLAKQSVSDTIKQLGKAGVEKASAEKLLAFIDQARGNEEKLSKLETNSEQSKQYAESTRKLLALIKQYGIKGDVKVDFSLARGLDYYTGFIWEFVVFEKEKKTPSIASGGRYDDLIALYSKTSIPAVGSSIGVNRILEMLQNKSPVKSFTQVFIAQIGDTNKEYALNICRLLRESGIYTDINITGRGISKQLNYANSIGAAYVVVIGDQEMNAKKAKLRNMATGKEELLDLNELIPKIKGA